MNLKQLKEECPKLPEDIRAMIEQEVAIQIQKPDRKKGTAKRHSWKKMMAVALAAAMAVGTTAFAGAWIYRWHTKREGKYGLKAGVGAKDFSVVSIPEEIPVLSFKAQYLPEGMVKEEGDFNKYYYQDTPYQGGISLSVAAMDEELSPDKLPLTATSVLSYESLNLDGLEVIYLEMEGETTYNRIYAAYPQYWQILEAYVGKDVPKEEALKMIQNLEVIPTGETKKLSECYTWGQCLKEEEASEESQERTTATREEMKNLHQIGEEFSVSYWDLEGLTAKVTDVQVADDFGLLKEDYISKEMKEALDGEGHLLPNHISYVQSGDGINSLDEIIKEEEVGQKLVLVSVEYTNRGEQELKDVLFNGLFLGIAENDHNFEIYDRASYDGDSRTDVIWISSRGRFGEMEYYDAHGGERENNHIPSIKPGESVTVKMAKIINEDELDKMYLSLDGMGGYLFSDSGLEMGYVDIRQK